jgi:trk system potassium uptake protein TrkA
MKIVFIGAGKVGYKLIEMLSEGNNDIVLIDKNPIVLKKIEDNLDVLCIKGNGVSTKTLLEAGVDKSDLLIAVTDSDEINMVCCLTAKKLGVKNTIARIRDPEYAEELVLLKEELGLDLIINPEKAAAEEISHILSFSPAVNIRNFAKGRVKFVDIKVTPDTTIVGKKLKDIFNKHHLSILVAAVVRDGEVTIPNGEFRLEENDEIYVIANHSNIYNFCKIAGKYPQKIRNVMIIGGGRISYYLTKLLTEMGMRVKIIEINKEKCLELSELLPEALIIHADGTDEEVLMSEGVENMDAFIAVTGIDEENLLSSLLIKRKGVKKVITKVSRANYISLVNELGIDSAFSPRLIVANQIIKYVRGKGIESFHRIIEDQGEVFEFIADNADKFINIPLKKLSFVENVLVSVVVRENEVIIPHGEDMIKSGDRVVVISKKTGISNLNDLMTKSLRRDIH